MTTPHYRTQWALIFLLFGIQQSCFAPWYWPFSRHKRQTTPQVQHIIFDLGGVLMQTNRAKAASTIGIGTFLYYMIKTFRLPTNIEPTMYNALDLALPLDPTGPLALSPNGTRLLPQIMRNWLSGTMTCAECKELATSSIRLHPECFVNSTEQAVVEKIAALTFCPEKIAEFQQPLVQGIEFVKKCKERGFEVYILSNLDAESYELLRVKYPQLFGLFDEKNIFVSGKIGLIKPDLSLFKLLLKQTGLDAQTCVFFDDQKENIAAARLCGINAFQCLARSGKPDYASMEKQLNALVAEQQRECGSEITQKKQA